MTVKVDDGEDRQTPQNHPAGPVTQDVTISVTNVDEPPAAPDSRRWWCRAQILRTRLMKPNESTDESEGGLARTREHGEWQPSLVYAVQYKKTDRDFALGSSGVTPGDSERSAPPQSQNLEADTSYQVRVQSYELEKQIGTENWSLVGTGSTNKEDQQARRSSSTAMSILSCGDVR